MIIFFACIFFKYSLLHCSFGSSVFFFPQVFHFFGLQTVVTCAFHHETWQRRQTCAMTTSADQTTQQQRRQDETQPIYLSLSWFLHARSEFILRFSITTSNTPNRKVEKKWWHISFRMFRMGFVFKSNRYAKLKNRLVTRLNPNAHMKCVHRWVEKDIARLLLLFALHFSLRFFFFFISENAFFHSCVLSRVFVEYRQFWNATPMQNNPKKKTKPHSSLTLLSVSGCICLWKYFNFANFSLLPNFVRLRIRDSISFPSN